MSADELNNLLNKLITLGGIEVRGVELCSPCDRPTDYLAKKDLNLVLQTKKAKALADFRCKFFRVDGFCR